MENEQEHPDLWLWLADEIESFRQERFHKNLRKKKAGCEDCGKPTNNDHYCDNCEMRHRLVFGGVK